MRALLLLLLVTLMSFSVMAQEKLISGDTIIGKEIFSGIIDCKIVDQQVIKFIDGKTTRYSGIKGERQVGDQVKFLVDITPSTPPTFKFSDLNVADYGIVVSIDADASFTDMGDASNFVSTQITNISSVTLFEEYFLNSRSIFGDILVQRYYKDDYQITYTKSSFDTTQNIFFNCVNAKTLTTGIDKFFKEVAKYR